MAIKETFGTGLDPQDGGLANFDLPKLLTLKGKMLFMRMKCVTPMVTEWRAVKARPANGGHLS